MGEVTYNEWIRRNEPGERGVRELAYWAQLLCGEWIQGYKEKGKILQLWVKEAYLYSVLLIWKSQMFLQSRTLLDVAALDDPHRPAGRFEVNYVLWQVTEGWTVQFKVQGGSALSIMSVSSLYPSSNWLEREVWDLYGIKFRCHPNLRRILTDYGFKGYPLRKDFPLMGFVELRYDDLYQAVLVEPVELSQSLRFFFFQRPWKNEDSSLYGAI